MTYPELSLDVQSIDTCINILLELKQLDGRYIPTANCYGDGLWTKGIIHRLNELGHWSEDQSVILEAKATLQSLRGVGGILKELLQSLETSVSVVRTALLPFQLGKGLDSLPDDVLSTIFEYVGLRKGLTRVSRRFSHIASNMPQLWSKISNRVDNKRYVLESLKNSGATGLDIFLYITQDDRRNDIVLSPLEMLDAVLPHSSRWKSLRISAKNADSWEFVDEIFSAIRKRCTGVKVNDLRSLCIECSPQLFIEGDMPAAHIPNALYFFESWSMPMLHDLFIMNMIPNPFMAPTLRSLRVEFHDLTGHSRVHSTRRLTEFISSFPHLEELCLSLGGRLKDEDGVPPVVLPNLKLLQIDVAQWLDEQLLATFMKALVTPSIHSMRLKINQDDAIKHIDLTEWLKILLCHEKYPTVKEFTFEYCDPEYNSAYCIPFKKLPNLHTLTLDTPNWFADYEYRRAQLPPLRRLHLKEVDGRWINWLRDTQFMLRSQAKKRWEGLQDLTVETVEGLDVEYIRCLFEPGEIIWGEKEFKARYSSSN